MPDPRAAIWDLDGTLIDSQDDHFHAWCAALGRPLTREQFAGVFGHRPDEIVRALLGPDLPDHAVADIVAAKWRAYRQRLQQHPATVQPGAREWLQRLAAAGWLQAVASDGARPNIEAVLASTGLAPLFGAVVSGDDVPHGKPDPAIFLLAARKLGAAPGRSIVIEDAPAGVEGAHRAGMRAVGVLTSHDALPADVVARRLTDLADGAFDALLSRPASP